MKNHFDGFSIKMQTKRKSHMTRNPFLNGILATTFESAGLIFSISEISSLA